MKERPILFSVVTGQSSQRGKRLRSVDGLTWKQRNKDAVNARRRELYAANPEKHRQRQREYKRGEAKPKVLAANREWLADVALSNAASGEPRAARTISAAISARGRR